MMKPGVLLLCFLALLNPEVFATPLSAPGPSATAKRAIPGSHVQHEKRTVEQGRRWVKVKRAEAQATLPMRIGLKQSNLEKGHDLLMDMCVILLLWILN